MQGTSEVAQESFSRTITAQSLHSNIGSDGAHVEDISLASLDHILSEIVHEHGRSMHVEIEYQLVKSLRIIQEITIVVYTSVIDEYLNLYPLCLAVVV